MMALDFDLIVIGSGPGGYTAAIRAAQVALRVEVDHLPPDPLRLLGGVPLGDRALGLVMQCRTEANRHLRQA